MQTLFMCFLKFKLYIYIKIYICILQYVNFEHACNNMFCRNVLTQGIKFVRLFQKTQNKKKQQNISTINCNSKHCKNNNNNINNVNKTMQTICGVSFLLIVLSLRRIVTHRPGFFQHFTIPLELNKYLYMYCISISIHTYLY